MMTKYLYLFLENFILHHWFYVSLISLIKVYTTTLHVSLTDNWIWLTLLIERGYYLSG
jgi:hypothetical protein